jgi:hypothetical protein
MNKSKVIAGIIFLVVYFVPFQMLFFTDEIVKGGKFIGLLLATIIGFFVAFGIGTNEPFNKKKENENLSAHAPVEMKKAA